jgi:hypothetical protein
VEIGGLRNLCVLNVRCNRLKSLPGELAWLRASTSLFISENPFCDAADVIADQPDAAAAHRVPSLRHLCGQVYQHGLAWLVFLGGKNVPRGCVGIFVRQLVE